jgi:hypothetical protein
MVEEKEEKFYIHDPARGPIMTDDGVKIYSDREQAKLDSALFGGIFAFVRSVEHLPQTEDLPQEEEVDDDPAEE